jgi:hypothetical protein
MSSQIADFFEISHAAREFVDDGQIKRPFVEQNAGVVSGREIFGCISRSSENTVEKRAAGCIGLDDK